MTGAVAAATSRVGGFADFFVMNRDGTDLHVLAETALHENHAHRGRSPGG